MPKLKLKIKDTEVIDRFSGKYEFLSNFYVLIWDETIKYEGIEYISVEHFFQAFKTLDLEERNWIADAMTPNLAKKRGRNIVLRSDWEEIKNEIMLTGLRMKFHNLKLNDKLLRTLNAELIEGNYWHDNYWGNCSCYKCQNIRGKNRLGELLMKVRSENYAKT